MSEQLSREILPIALSARWNRFQARKRADRTKCGEETVKNAEMQMEDDYGMIDGIINNGKAADHDRKEKKPSVLEQLRNQPIQERTHKTAPKKSAEREI